MLSEETYYIEKKQAGHSEDIKGLNYRPTWFILRLFVIE
jgi:hypothetical protein